MGTAKALRGPPKGGILACAGRGSADMVVNIIHWPTLDMNYFIVQFTGGLGGVWGHQRRDM